jgi:hypothetical protein
MRSSLPDPRILLFPAFSLFILAAAGCQSGESAKTLDATGQVQPAEQAKPSQEKVTEAELRGYCPKVTLRDGTTFFNTYAKGGQDDPTKVVYQASISDVSRSCAATDGAMTMKVAVAGRVVPGPAFSPGTITMPIRVVVTHGDEVLYSQLHQHQVNVADASAAVQFLFNDPNVSFVLPADRRVAVFAGYDEGPTKKPKQ